MIFDVDQGGIPIEDVVQAWIDDNRAKWEAWTQG